MWPPLSGRSESSSNLEEKSPVNKRFTFWTKSIISNGNQAGKETWQRDIAGKSHRKKSPVNKLVKKHDKKQQTSTFGLGDIPVPGWIAIIWICLKVQYALIWCFVTMFNIKWSFYRYPNFQTHPCGQSQILTATGWEVGCWNPPFFLQHPEIPIPLRWNTKKTW